MPGAVSEESVVGKSMEEIASEQHSQTGEALTEWRSSEQVENGTPSTSPSYWDIDDDEDCGPKPCQLYGKYTWKIDKFSQINKRELRGDTFEVGGYKWYILIYPQGCDVCNHLSLFLCVANHDKLLPGWSHFAQFTIAVVNKDPKKSKYSDTLHRFWKKEHDWGWKKFMELSKVLDGFIDSDTLTIKAQVQVLRERADRPFRCLDSQYRRELVRVYLTNVEQICRRFVEERRAKLVKLIEDKTRWSSFRAFWLGIDQNSKHCMSKEKADTILKVVVKHFFVEKEVTSTLVMDSLYSGLKALKGQSKSKSKALKEVTSTFKLLDAEEVPSPVICMEKDMFVLVDDALQLLERAAMEQLPPKDDKGPQNRTKDGTPGEELIKDSIERDERRLTELGRRTVEIFVLAHIFSNKIEVAYQEAIALKRQEELIREEEAAWLAENGQKAKRGAADKEKKSKKKQAKQKRKNRKGKDKGKDNKPTVANQEDPQQYASVVGRKIRPLDKSNAPEIVSDISVSAERAAENFLPVSEDRNMAQACGNGSSGRSSAQNGMLQKRKPSVMDDSSSTCSTDSAPSVAVSGPCKGNGFFPGKNEKAPCRGKHHQERGMGNGCNYLGERYCLSPEIATNSAHINDARKSCNPIESETEPDLSLQDRAKWFEEPTVKKEREVASSNRKLGVVAKPQVDSKSPSKQKAPPTPSSSRSSSAGPLVSPLPVKKASNITNKPRTTLSAAARKSTTQQVPSVTRPLSAPLVPGPTPAAPSASTAQVFPTLARSASATGRLGPDAPLPTRNNSDAPQSYKNVMMGGTPEAARDAVQDENQAAESPYSELKSARSDIRSSDTHKRVGSDSVRQNVNALEDEYYEYPHLDMINHLLDGEDEFSPRSRSTSSSNGPRFLNRRLSFPEELGVPGDLCSCRLERTCYRDGFSVCYGSAGVHLGSFPPRYVNREIDGVDMNPWRMTGPDFSLFSRMVAPLESKVVDPYRVPEHWNIPCDLTGYPVF